MSTEPGHRALTSGASRCLAEPFLADIGPSPRPRSKALDGMESRPNVRSERRSGGMAGVPKVLRPQFAVCAAMTSLILSACMFSTVSRDEASRLALGAAGPDSTVLSAELGRLGDFVGTRTLADVPRDRGVWAVIVAGQFPGECVVTASGGTRCPHEAETALILIGRSDRGVLTARGTGTAAVGVTGGTANGRFACASA